MKKVLSLLLFLTNYCGESYDIYMSKVHGFDILSKGVDLIIDRYNTNSLTKMNDTLSKVIKTIHWWSAKACSYLSLESISIFKDIYVNIFDYANWLSLNFRASERMYR